MKDQSRTKQALIQELASLRQGIEALKQSESESEWEKERDGLKKSEARFRSYFDLPLYGIAISSPEKGWIEANDRICSIMGYSRDEIVRMTWAEMTHPDDLAADLEQFNGVLSGQMDHYHLEKRFIRKDGKVIWTHLSVGCVRKPDGSVDHIVAVVEDITGVKLAEEALRERDIRFQKLYSHVPGMIYQFMKRPDGNYCVPFTTEAIKDIFDCSPEDVREDFSPITKVIFPGDLDKLMGSIESSAAGMTAWQCEYRVQIPGRPIRWMFGHSTPEKLAGGGIIWHGFNMDITDRRQAEEALRSSEEKYRLIFDNAPLGILHFNEKGIITSCNDKFVEIIGSSQEVLVGLNMLDLPDKHIVGAVKLALNGEPGYYDGKYRSFTASKVTPVHALFAAIAPEKGKVIGGVGIIEDITVREKAEEALKESEEKYRSLFENANEAIFVAQDGKLVFFNPRTAIISGYTPDELMSKPFIEFIHRDDRETVIDRHMRRMRGEELLQEYNFRIIHKDGCIRWVELNAVFISWQDKQATLNFMNDITDRKLAEEALRESEERYRTILNEMEEGYQEVDLAGRFTYFNEAFLRIFGYSRDEMMGTNFSRFAAEEAIAKNVYCAYNDMYNTGLPIKSYEWDIIRKDGVRRTIEFCASVLRDSQERPTGFRGIVRDITDRRRAGVALRESEERLNKAQMISHVGSWEIDLSTNGLIWSDEVYRIFGLQPQEIVATYESFLDLIHPDDRAAVDNAYSSSLREGRDSYEIEHRVIRKHTHDVRYIYERCEHARDASGRIVRSVGMVQDITDRKNAEEQLRRTLDSLRKAFGATIQVMVSAIEVRDPYTAGHQIRTTDLARAIAAEMGLSHEKIDGIRMAGSIHDIGKLSIPAEILSKPTRLTDLEYSLIKEHSRLGYEILKDVESPWALAEIVYQHHERMDGSGYPRKLKGDEILMEARIMAVADVVESMASHRPYRPALGLKAALEEIEGNRGTLYDSDAADACLRLFREKGFQLE
jgi:PAS domain S-box-containing protein